MDRPQVKAVIRDSAIQAAFPLRVAYQIYSFHQSFRSTQTPRTHKVVSYNIARQLSIYTVFTRSSRLYQRLLMKYISQYLSSAKTTLYYFTYTIYLLQALISLQQLSFIDRPYIIRFILSINLNLNISLSTYQNSSRSSKIKNRKSISNRGDLQGIPIYIQIQLLLKLVKVIYIYLIVRKLQIV